MTKNDIFLLIPYIYYISEQLLNISKENKKKELIFIITACQMSIEMYSDLSKLINIKGVSIQLKGQICPNYKSFLLAEKGIKNGLTTLNQKDKNLIMNVLKLRWENFTFKN